MSKRTAYHFRYYHRNLDRRRPIGRAARQRRRWNRSAQRVHRVRARLAKGLPVLLHKLWP
jgi:hypothetical protein